MGGHRVKGGDAHGLRFPETKNDEVEIVEAVRVGEVEAVGCRERAVAGNVDLIGQALDL